MAKKELSKQQLEEISSASGIPIGGLSRIFHFLPLLFGVIIGEADFKAAADKANVEVTDKQVAKAVAIIGGADGPTSIFL